MFFDVILKSIINRVKVKEAKLDRVDRGCLQHIKIVFNYVHGIIDISKEQNQTGMIVKFYTKVLT